MFRTINKNNKMIERIKCVSLNFVIILTFLISVIILSIEFIFSIIPMIISKDFFVYYQEKFNNDLDRIFNLKK